MLAQNPPWSGNYGRERMRRRGERSPSEAQQTRWIRFLCSSSSRSTSAAPPGRPNQILKSFPLPTPSIPFHGLAFLIAGISKPRLASLVRLSLVHFDSPPGFLSQPRLDRRVSRLDSWGYCSRTCLRWFHSVFSRAR